MEIKKVTKRLFAIGTGALMLGATAMGALAAVDLKDYPAMFVKNGTFNGYLVVGEKAAAVDNLAMTDIAAGMKYLKAAETTTTTVEGDAWKVGTSVKKLEMANSNASASAITGENLYDIETFIGKENLKALADGTFNTGEGQYGYRQYLYFDPENVATNELVKFAEDDDDKMADFLYFQSGKNISKYVLEFTSPAQSDITDSAGSSLATGTYLDDFENTKLNILGKEYTVVMARRVTATSSAGDIKLVLMSGAVKDSLLEGEEKTFTIGGKEYKIKLIYVDATYAKFTVNGENTDKLQVGETKKLSDGKEVGVSEVLYQSYAGGVHSATFFLGAGKIELKDDVIDAAVDVSNYPVIKGGSEDVDGSHVFIHGSNTSSTVKINTIRVDMNAPDDMWVPAGGKLSDQIVAIGEDKELLFTNNFDIEYKGLSTEKTNNIKLSTSSDRKYKLIWYDGDGKKVDMPLTYAASSTRLQLSEDASDKALVLREGLDISKNDYFVLTGGIPGSGTAKSYLLQYKGSDASTDSNPKIKFKNIGSGESLEYSVGSANPRATIKLGGNSFEVYGGAAADDFGINVSFNGDSDFLDGVVTVVDYYGAQINFNASAGVSVNNFTRLENVENFSINITTPYTSDYNDQAPSDIVLKLAAATTNKVATTALLIAGTSNPLLNPAGEENMYYGYTSMGGKLTYSTPSSSPYEFTYAYPENQVLPQVYVTSGATTTDSTTGGTWTPVAIVDATKLDSEVADFKAQNLIVVGGPCVNTVAASLLGNPASCADGFTAGKAKVKLFENGASVAMLVAGYTGEDTRLAGKVIANRWKEMKGTEVEVEGTTYTDAKVGAPVPVVVAAPVVE